jgi:hypothetical protein
VNHVMNTRRLVDAQRHAPTLLPLSQNSSIFPLQD